MKVAWLMPNLHITGGARVAVELSDRMVERGHDFSLLIPTGRYRLPYKLSAKVIECGKPVKNPLIAVLSGMTSMMQKVPEVDVIIGCMPPYALLAGKIARKRGIPAVNYVLNDDVHFFDDKSFIRSELLLKAYRSIARRAIKSVTVFVNSHWTAVRCVSEGGGRPFAIVPHGFNPDVFFPVKDGKSRTGMSDLPGIKNSVRLITVGRHIRWKGFNDLVDALNLIDRNKYSFELIVVSQDELDISKADFNITLNKPDNDRELADLYRSGEIFIHSSWFEGFGMPPLEAQACGLAVISTDCGGIREFLRDKENALIVSPREPRTLAWAIMKLICDVGYRNKIADRGLEDSVEFTWDKVADRFEDALERLKG
ncbi:MAG: glycosyltransferase family 4 protein [Candidatus Hatepunaea meridiana]|nr:glycosyltransferase family 4 protein [Candidatus Hatepunaea meridiana]